MRSDEAIMTAVRQTRSDAAELKKALMLIGFSNMLIVTQALRLISKTMMLKFCFFLRVTTLGASPVVCRSQHKFSRHGRMPPLQSGFQTPPLGDRTWSTKSCLTNRPPWPA
jgi:hypothetical protein